MLETLLTNDVFTGLAGGSLFASALYAARAIPEKLMALLVWRFSSSVTVHNDDESFYRVTEWLSTLPRTKESRRTHLSMRYSGDEETPVLSPGQGWHMLRDGKDIIFLHREDNEDSQSFFRRQTLYLRVIGGPERLRRLVDRAMKTRLDSDKLHVFMYQGYWKKVYSKKKRPLDTVVLPREQKQRILRDITRFIAPGTQAWYEDRGIPYRRGHLWEGPSGTGKTSLALAVAGAVDRPLYALNLGSLSSDESLFNAILSVPSEAILLIEDIDATRASGARAEGEPKKDEKDEKPEKSEGITLSGLLNAIDGAFSRDGRVLIMTSNHPGKVDEALFRPGRIDHQEHIGLIGRSEALELSRNILRDDIRAQSFVNGLDLPIKPAALQVKLVKEAQGAP